MKKMFLGPAGMILMGVMALSSPVIAADLLDVKPIMSGSTVAIEVTADIPMTYTYYNIPGQTRAVVDIADADCEKVEPLIVVNKGSIASISVDKAVISGMTVSRLIFNLVSQADIAVSQAADRKKIVISFGGGAPAASVATPPAQIDAPVAPPIAKPVAAAAVPVPVPAPAPAPGAATTAVIDDDPLGLDEPKPVSAAPVAAKSEPSKPKAASYPAMRSQKLEPVVPADAPQAATVSSIVKGIVIGSSHIDILANGRVESFKQLKLTKPDRLAIDIPGTHTVASRNLSVNKFGISKIRVGSNPGFTRIVLDGSKSPFPLFELLAVDDGLRIMFK